MNKYINKKMAGLVAYGANQPEYKVKLDANESPFAPSKKSLQKICDALLSMEFNRYPDPTAREVCKKYAKYIGVDKNNVVAGNGSDELISVIINLFFEDGDKLLILKPDFSMYEFYAKLADIETIVLQKDKESLSLDIDVIIDSVKKHRPRAVIFSNPCNPTGQGYSSDQILKLVKSCGCICIVDEAYMEFFGDSVADQVNNFDNLIVLKTISKIGYAAIRLGFAVSNFELTEQIRRGKSPYNVNSLTQTCAFVFLNDKEYIRKCVDCIVDERKYLENRLFEILNKSGAGFKLFSSKTNFSVIESDFANDIFLKLLKMDISVRCINKKYLRITAGTREQNDIFLSAFAKIVKDLKK